MQLLEDFSEDAEQFYAIRDSLSLYEDYTALDIRCYACSSPQHLLTKCPYLHHRANREVVILLHNKSVMQERNSNFERTRVRQESMLHGGIYYLTECAKDCINDHMEHPKIAEYFQYLDKANAYFQSYNHSSSFINLPPSHTTRAGGGVGIPHRVSFQHF